MKLGLPYSLIITSTMGVRPFDPPASNSNAVRTPAGRSSPDESMISAAALVIMVRVWWVERDI